MSVKQLTRIAFLGSLLYIVFHSFSNFLYIEMITFTLCSFSLVFSRKEVVIASFLFGMIQILFHGLMFWNVMYILIYPTYAYLCATYRSFFMRHKIGFYMIGGFFSFLTGQLVELPFLLVSKKVTLIYMLMGLKTSLIQGCITFLEFLMLHDPVQQLLERIEQRK